MRVAQGMALTSRVVPPVVADRYDLKHIASSLAFNHRLPFQGRSVSLSLYKSFHGDFYENPKDRRDVRDRREEAQIKLKAKIDQQRRN